MIRGDWARLESVYTSKAYREFESRSLRKIKIAESQIKLHFQRFSR